MLWKDWFVVCRVAPPTSWHALHLHPMQELLVKVHLLGAANTRKGCAMCQGPTHGMDLFNWQSVVEGGKLHLFAKGENLHSGVVGLQVLFMLPFFGSSILAIGTLHPSQASEPGACG